MAETTRQVGDVIEFPGKGRVRIDWINGGWIGFREMHYDTDHLKFVRMTFATFEASVSMTLAKYCGNTADEFREAR